MTYEKLNADWTAVRADYDARVLTVEQVAVKHGVSRALLYRIASRNGWQRRHGHRFSRDAVIRRLTRLLEVQITQMETRMANPDQRATDKEVAILGNLTRNLEKLIALDNKDNAGGTAPGSSARVEALRKKLADRIDQLRAS